MNQKILTFCLISALGGASCSAPKSSNKETGNTNKTEYWLLVGSYAHPEEEGIKVYRFDQETGESTYQSGLKGLSNPSFLTPSADGTHVYAVGEEEGLTSTAAALKLNVEKGDLTIQNIQLTHGGAPCFIALSPDESRVVTANYMGGSISIFGLDESGKLSANPQIIHFSGQGPNRERQEQPHLHQVNFTPDGQFLLANDLGTDHIYSFPLATAQAAESNTASANESASANASYTRVGNPSTLILENQRNDLSVTAGSGPRHLCFHPNGKWAYLLGELSGEITFFTYENGTLMPIQSLAADTTKAQGSADIHCSPDGHFLYASNRLQADGLAIFAVDSIKGTLTPVGYQPTGIHPRNFILSPNGKFLLVACRDSHCIQVFSRDLKTGLLSDTGHRIETSRPVCLQWVAIR